MSNVVLDTTAIRAAAHLVDTIRKDLRLLEDEAAVLGAGSYQKSTHLVVNGRPLAVTTCAHPNYVSRAVRGMEMVLLGIQKYYSSLIDAKKAELLDAEAALRSAAGGSP